MVESINVPNVPIIPKEAVIHTYYCKVANINICYSFKFLFKGHRKKTLRLPFIMIKFALNKMS